MTEAQSHMKRVLETIALSYCKPSLKVKQVEVERSCYSESKLHTPRSGGLTRVEEQAKKSKK